MSTVKFARFLFEFHYVRFERLDLPLLPADSSDFDVHCALEDDKVKTEKHCSVLNIYCYVLYILFHLYALSQLSIILGYYACFLGVVVYISYFTC